MRMMNDFLILSSITFTIGEIYSLIQIQLKLYSITKIDLTKWLSSQLETTLKAETISNDDKKELLRYMSPIKPRSQPFVGHLLQSWLHFHNEL